MVWEAPLNAILPNVQCCKVNPTAPISKVTVNGQLVNLPNGNCKSKNVIYLAQCNLCVDNCYVGRTVQPLNKRVNGHHHAFVNVVNKGPGYVNSLGTDNTYNLGVHLYNEHGLSFEIDKHYTFHVEKRTFVDT